ncbi:small multi-drug export protein [Novipirellula sp. SH528]|uniref:small multi-drug export protein n=1 Tax=Novipirellula sp. SH528 TaxID=3454466 RepID=UPI003FA141EA
MSREVEEQDLVRANPDAVDVTAGIDETAFRREYPIVWWLTLLGPLVLTASVVFFVWKIAGPRVVWRLISTSVATFFFFGKFVILGGSDGDLLDAANFFTAEQLFLIVLYMDVMTGCLLVFHLGFLFKLPMVGEKLNELVQDGNFILKSNRWMKRATFLGLVAFVMFPLAATGSVGGSIFGRLLGLGRLATLIGIVVGSILGGGLMYFGSELITRYVGRDNPLLMVGGITVVAAILYLLNYRYRQLKERQT